MLQEYEKRLAEVEKIITDNQMTLDLLQTEATLERAQNLHRDIAERKSRIRVLREEWHQLLGAVDAAEHLLEIPERSKSPSLDEAEKDLITKEQQLTRAELHVCDAVRRLGVALPRLKENSPDAVAIRNRVRQVEQKFRDLVRRTQEERIQLETRAVDEGGLRKQLEELVFWCDEALAELSTKMNPLDSVALEAALNSTEKRNTELISRKAGLATIEAAKERLLSLETVDAEAKHAIRRAVCDVAKRLADVSFRGGT